MIEVMFGSLFGMLTFPKIMGLMMLAVVIGLIVGATLGIGGRLSIAPAIPFIYGMEMIAGAVFLSECGQRHKRADLQHHVRGARGRGRRGHHPRRLPDGQEGRNRPGARRQRHGVRVAMRRGEIQGAVASRSTYEQFVQNGYGKFVAQIGGNDKDVPQLSSLVNDAAAGQPSG